MTSFYKYIISVCALLPPFFSWAQQDSSSRFITESFQLQYHRYTKEAITQPLLKLRNYNSVQAGYASEEGKYRQAQAPQKQNILSFFTEGSRQLKKVLVTGSFGWYNTKTDSQAFTMRQNYKDPQPYYFYAVQPGNWQTIRYNLEGMASLPILNDRFILGAKAAYNTLNAWRSNDPRPEEFQNEMKGNIIAHYKIKPHHIIGIGGGLISNKYDNNWEYRDDNNRLKPLMAVYIHNGYGSVNNSFTQTVSGSISSRAKGYSVEALYEGALPIGVVTVTGKYELLSTEIFERSGGAAQTDKKYGEFNNDAYAVNLNWYKTIRRNSINVNVDFRDELGKDFNNELAANNYVNAFQQTKLETVFSRMNGKGSMKYEIGASAMLEDRMRKDGSLGQKAAYQNLEAAFTGAWYWNFPGNNGVLKTAIRMAYKEPIHAEAVSVRQQFLFSEGVVYSDYYYFNAQTMSFGAQFAYQLSLKQFNPFIKLAGNYINATIPDPKEGLIPWSYPGNNRLQWQCSIGLNL